LSEPAAVCLGPLPSFWSAGILDSAYTKSSLKFHDGATCHENRAELIFLIGLAWICALLPGFSLTLFQPVLAASSLPLSLSATATGGDHKSTLSLL
jgi:hypothetical protein